MNCHCYPIVPDLPAPSFHCTLTPSSSNDNGQLRQKALKIPATLLCEGHNSFDGSLQTGFVAWKDLSVYMNNKKISTTFRSLSRHLCWQHVSGFGVTKMMRENIEMASISENPGKVKRVHGNYINKYYIFSSGCCRCWKILEHIKFND